MPGQPTPLVIRTQRPWVRRAIWITALAILPIVLYLTYELGRFDGGYDRSTVGQRRRELEVEIERLQKANTELRANVAELETGRTSQQQEREELARTIADLQAQVGRQSQDVAFYRGLVNSTLNAPNIKVQKFEVLPGEGNGKYHLRMVLVQAVRPDNVVSGTVELTVEGTERGQPAKYGLARLTGDGRNQLQFSFRYFQDLDQEVALPDGFQPGRVNVEVKSAGRSAPWSQTFNWDAQTS
jgi:cell division protein FtsB